MRDYTAQATSRAVSIVGDDLHKALDDARRLIAVDLAEIRAQIDENAGRIKLLEAFGAPPPWVTAAGRR